MEELDMLPSMGSQRVRCDLVTNNNNVDDRVNTLLKAHQLYI